MPPNLPVLAKDLSSLVAALVLASCPLTLTAQEAVQPEATFRAPALFQWSLGGDVQGGPASRDEPLISDRPDFTEASTTVGQGVVQLETGYTYTHDGSGGSRTTSHSFPEALFRIGMFADWFELRIAYTHGAELSSLSGAPPITGRSDELYLGAKIALTLQQGFLPEMAIIPQMTVPLAGDTSFAQTTPGMNWLYGWQLSEHIGTGGSTQLNKALDADGSVFYELAQSWTVNFQLTEQLGCYTEWYAFFPSGAAFAQPQHYFDGGFTFLASNDWQLDIRAGVGLNEAAADYFVGTGLVRRF
jgi:hypothetical protein